MLDSRLYHIVPRSLGDAALRAEYGTLPLPAEGGLARKDRRPQRTNRQRAQKRLLVEFVSSGESLA